MKIKDNRSVVFHTNGRTENKGNRCEFGMLCCDDEERGIREMIFLTSRIGNRRRSQLTFSINIMILTICLKRMIAGFTHRHFSLLFTTVNTNVAQFHCSDQPVYLVSFHRIGDPSVFLDAKRAMMIDLIFSS